MVYWGIAWGAVLGLLWHGSWTDTGFRMIVGAVLGAIAGLTLRKGVRAEVARQQALASAREQVAARPAVQPVAVPAAAPAPRPMPAQPSASVPVPATPVPTLAPVREPASAAAEPSRPAPVRRPPRVEEPDLVTTLVLRARDWLLGGNTVVRIGILVLFVGLAFLAKYAVENALLPPQLRLAAIAAAGIALFVFGFRMRARPGRAGYAMSLQGAGVAVLYLTVFAAFRLYQFLPPMAAFAALGLVCLFSAVIALAQNAQALAFIGFAGGFAAPILVSTGQGNHVGLFGYYLLLGVAIAVIAWSRAWRPLNLLGFFATFGVATLWGALKYDPRHFATTEPFLVAFFLVYLLASLFYALRHGHPARRAVDGTLVFGTPIVAFGLQVALVRDMEYAAAFSSLALGALYVALGWWTLKRRSGDATVGRWLAECFLALALGFLTLAVPLALDGRWTSAVWAVEGAAVFWMGRRQGRRLARAAGLALQVLATLLYLDNLHLPLREGWYFANPGFLGATMLAGAALAIAWWSRDTVVPGDSATATAREFARVEASLSRLLFWAGFLWWMFALGIEIHRVGLTPQGDAVRDFAPAQRQLLHMMAWILSAFALHRLALPTRARPWPIAATPAWLVLPVMLWTALWGMAHQDHVFQGLGWFLWPAAIVLHIVLLRRLDGGRPAAWWPWVHAGGVWLAVLLAGNLLVSAIDRADLWRTAWATVILLVSASVVLLVLVLSCRGALQGARARWPLDRFTSAYAWRAALPLAIGVALGALLVAIGSSGQARPLPYIPLLNPTDLSVALALVVCALWLRALRASSLPLPGILRDVQPAAALAAIAFVAVNTVWLRVAHHYAGVPWDASDLFESFVVQAGYSILWTVMALVLMVAAHRRARRLPWMLGGGLLALTVLKLFVVDLSNRGGSERIVTFIVVGVLMLVVGWIAPIPPARRPPDAQGELQGATP